VCASSFLLAAACGGGASSTVGTTLTTGITTFETSYAGRLETTYAPPLHGMATTTTALEAKWVGPCAAGQKPGDTEVLMPGMRGLNLNEMLKNMPAVR
jgi:hypothetical protein